MLTVSSMSTTEAFLSISVNREMFLVFSFANYLGEVCISHFMSY